MAEGKRPVSGEALVKATGKSWQRWFKIIDSATGLDKTNHTAIARWLYENHLKKGWWVQSITVGYEYEKGLRKLGGTKTAGFEIGVQKTIYQPADKLWGFLLSSVGLKIWLGDIKKLELTPKAKYQTKDGVSGQIRSVYPEERLRLTYQPQEFKKPSTLQIYLFCPRNTPNKTSVRFHQEKLASSRQRTQMKQHWQQVLGQVAQSLPNNSK